MNIEIITAYRYNWRIEVSRMTIQEAISKSDMSIYRLAKNSKVPYATVNDIVNGKTDIRKCSFETMYRLSQALKVPMEELIESYM